MRLMLAGVRGPLLPVLRDRLVGAHELVQLGGAWLPGVAVATGDLGDAGDVHAAADGAETLVCDLQGALAEIEAGGAPEEALGEALEGAVAHLIEARRRVGARRLLILGSGRAVCARPERDEPHMDLDDLRHWPRLAALRRAMDLAATDPAALTLAPAVLLGPGLQDSALLRRLALLRAGLAPPSAVVRLSLADVRDVGAVAEAALTRGAPGRTYVVGSRPFWLLTLDRAVPFVGAPRSPLPALPDDLPVGVAWERAPSRAATADLGWWTRRAGRTLADTLRALDGRDARTGLS